MDRYKVQYRGEHTGYITLTTPAPVVLTDAETYYQLQGVYTDNNTNNGFSTGVSGTLVFTGDGPAKLILNGTSEAEVSQAAEVTYGLFKNGTLILGAETPHSFAANNKRENFSITSILVIEKGDTFSVRAKTDNAGITLTVRTLNVTLHEA